MNDIATHYMFVSHSPLPLSADSLLFEGLVRGLECGQVLELHTLAGQAVLPVAQLHHLVDGVPHRGVIFDHHRLHRLNQTTLDVT